MSVTLKQVAKEAGVSVSAVSAVINNPDSASPTRGTRVSNATRRRVLQTAKKLNYRPNHLSRSLAKGKSMSIGIIGKGASLTTVAVQRTHYLTQAAYEKGYFAYSVNIAQRGDDSKKVERATRDLIARQVDGLVIHRNMPVSIEVQKFLESLDIPTVFLGDWGPQESQHRIVLDLEAGIKQLAEHLAELGHKRAVHFASDGTGDFTEHKVCPYQRQFEKVGIELDAVPYWIVGQPRVGDKAYRAVYDYLETENIATTFLMSNDLAAMGALAAIRSAGLRVPEDISVAGFDNLDGSQNSFPSLTTVAEPDSQKVGQATFDMLYSLMSNHKTKVEKQVFTYKTIVRNSTGPAPNNNITTATRRARLAFNS